MSRGEREWMEEGGKKKEERKEGSEGGRWEGKVKGGMRHMTSFQ